MKKAIKKTVKVKRPKYIISMLDVANANDVTAYFIGKKISAGMRVTDCDYDTVISILTDALLDEILPENGCAVVKDDCIYLRCKASKVEEKTNKPWYKRLWNWITRTK
mgnify:CR=1 FL=1|jgi:hypothetical protein